VRWSRQRIQDDANVSSGCSPVSSSRHNTSSPTYGSLTANGKFTVLLADSGSRSAPIALGAALVIIYRVLTPAPLNALNAIVLYKDNYASNKKSNKLE
jgi:hypothetical protein